MEPRAALPVDQVMKRMLLCATLAATMAVAWPAHAQQQRDSRHGAETPGPAQPAPRGREWQPRTADMDRPRPPAQKTGLSPEERRELRRDISNHGREIYPEPPRRR